MSLAVCNSFVPLPPLGLEGGGVRCGEGAFSTAAAVMSPETWLTQEEAVTKKEVADKGESQLDIWSSIQSSKKAAADLPPPYVHPLLRRLSSLSQKSLEICTESLGSETGSDGFSSEDYYSSKEEGGEEEEEEVSETEQVTEEGGDEAAAIEGKEYSRRHQGRKELATVNYHCSIGRKSPPRSFPPPLPSISRRDGPCLHMRPHRRDGRLVVEAVPVPSQNYLHAQRQGGRLLLSFIDTSFQEIYPEEEDPIMEHQQQLLPNWEEADAGVDDRGLEDDDDYEDNSIDGEEEEGEEEVEVVERGIVVEVKVSRQPQMQSGGGMKVHRSSLVINKFVGGTPLSNQNPWAERAGKMAEEAAPPRRLVPNSSSSTTTTAAVAVAAASSSGSAEPYWRNGRSTQIAQEHSSCSPDKLHFISKKLMNRQALLHQVRRCSQSHRPLFIWESCCIATS